MFGQNNDHHDDQSTQDDNNNFLVSSPFAGPAPGAPAGPVEDNSQPDNSAPAATVVSDDLLDIKQNALQELTPLVGHLEQTPEEKFKTTMMMIQATDDKSLIKSAYESAKQITDEKARAQALLDVVNEINYFTQNGHQS